MINLSKLMQIKTCTVFDQTPDAHFGKLLQQFLEDNHYKTDTMIEFEKMAVFQIMEDVAPIISTILVWADMYDNSVDIWIAANMAVWIKEKEHAPQQQT